MQFSLSISLMLVAGAIATPMLDPRNLPEAVADHMHNHMSFHHKRQDNTPADQMMSELDMLFEKATAGQNPGWNAPASPPQAPAQPAHPQAHSPAQPPVQNRPNVVMVNGQKEDVVVVTHTYTETVGGPTHQPAKLEHFVSPPPASVPAPVVKVKPATTYEEAQPPEHVKVAKPAAPAPQVPSTDGLPTTFVEGLDTESAVYKGLAALHHNIHRTNHSVDPMSWNDTLFEYAKQTAQTCIYGHSLAPGGGGYGQNIAAGNAPGNISSVITNGFYNGEIELFTEAIGGSFGNNNPDMTNFEQWGHFTQLVWQHSQSFGCYTSTCSPPGADALDCNSATGQSYLQNVGCGNGGTEAYFTVCNYYPPGNYAGEYSAVKAPDHSVPFVQMTSNGVEGL